jgi:hypothetical protein
MKQVRQTRRWGIKPIKGLNDKTPGHKTGAAAEKRAETRAVVAVGCGDQSQPKDDAAGRCYYYPHRCP